MKHDPAEAVARFRELVERYHRTLDLMSERGLAEFDRLADEAARYAEVIAEVSPAPCTVLDVGSGVGLPGIVVAAALPEHRVVLVERRRKRGSFLRLVVGQLGLRNADVRVEDVRRVTDVRAQVITAQAVAPLADVVELTRGVQDDPVVVVSRRGEAAREAATRLAAELGCDVAVVAERALGHRGSLVALRLPGGRACPSSG